MKTTRADFAEQDSVATQPAPGLLPNLLAHLQRQREEMRRAAQELTAPLASTASHGETNHERSQVDHRRS